MIRHGRNVLRTEMRQVRWLEVGDGGGEENRELERVSEGKRKERLIVSRRLKGRKGRSGLMEDVVVEERERKRTRENV